MPLSVTAEGDASTTGNTEAMANAVAEGVKESGAELVFAQASEADAAEVASAGAVVLNGEGLKAQLTPDEAALAECKELGKIS